MGHISEGLLRRLIDDPLAANDSVREHFGGCQSCQKLQLEMKADAVLALLPVVEVPIEISAALAKIRPRLVRSSLPLRLKARFSAPNRARLTVAMVMALLVLSLSTAVASSNAWLPFFSPRQISSTSVTIPTSQEIAGLPDLSKYGTLTVLEKGQSATYFSLAQAEQASSLSLPAPSASLAKLPMTYLVVGQSKGTFTFSQAKGRQNYPNSPAFPSGMDGSSLAVTTGPSLVAVYGEVSNISLGSLPTVYGVSVAPVVLSDGPSLPVMINFLISLPSIANHPDLVAEIKAIGDPLASGTLTIPIPVGLAQSKPVSVNGSSGVLISDLTGTGEKALVWEHQNKVYIVAGPATENQLQDLAKSF